MTTPTQLTACAPASRPIRLILRAESLLLLIAVVYAYGQLQASWWWFAAVFLLPDLAMLAYALGPRWGAWAYNCTHSYTGPALLGMLAYVWVPSLWATCCVWLAHIAMDRALGYGLKSSQGFSDTHLGTIGKSRPAVPKPH